MTTNPLLSLTTPALLVDREKLQANCRRLATRIDALGCVLRPHVKTHKSLEVTADIVAAGHTRGITVSTLKEANYFFSGGHDDIFYAVGISPNKFAAAADLIRRGCRLQVTLDNLAAAQALSTFAAAENLHIPVLIELDVDGHRAGADPEGEDLLTLAAHLNATSHLELRGVMTHAGSSYGCSDWACLRRVAKQERDRSLAAATRIREAGLPCPVVSIGSTPTAFAIDNLEGITEIRAGVYALMDLVMANVGVCTLSDIAASVLVTVTGHQRDKGWVITDGGWMALSRDRGTADQQIDFGYGAVADARGQIIDGLIMSGANQEHGIVSMSDNRSLILEDYPVGSQLRVLPNHACSTLGQFDELLPLEGEVLLHPWHKTKGW